MKMLVIHVYVLGKDGAIERAFDFLRNDGKEELDGVDIVIPYKEREEYKNILEKDVLALISTKEIRKDH